MELGKWISKDDALLMLEITNSSIVCNSEEDYKNLIEQSRGLLPFDNCVTVSADLRQVDDRNIDIPILINNGFSDEYLKEYIDNKYQLVDPLYKRFVKTFEIQCSKDLKHFFRELPYYPLLKLREDFKVENLFIYGSSDLNIKSFTVVNISGKHLKTDQRTRAIITYLVPCLSIAIKNLYIPSAERKVAVLTAMEIEVLKWLKEGKSSWEISMILGKSERTVNFHTNNLINKLNANNRTHAVAIAIENKIIGI
jgi:LuxR family transcriptional regulator, quorum-sensing system regulator CviR